MKTVYRYRVIMCLGNGPFLYHDTNHKGEAINICLMLQKAQGHSAQPGDWSDINTCGSITASNIELQRTMISGDMSQMMAEDEQTIGQHGPAGLSRNTPKQEG